MPQINLTTLSGQELRQRLDSSRSRGDAALAYEILREMAARRAKERGRRPLLKRRPAEPRVVDVDLGDPMDKDEELPPMPHWRAPELMAAEARAPVEEAEPPPRPEPPPAPKATRKRHPIVAIGGPVAEAPELPAAKPTDVEALPHFRSLDAPLTLSDPEPAPWVLESDPEPAQLRLDVEASPARKPRPRSGHALRVAAGFAVGITSGVALGWFAAGLAQDAPAPAAAVQVASQAAPAAPAPAVLEVVAEPAVPPSESVGAPPMEFAEAAAPATPEPEAPAAAEPPEPIQVAEKPVPERPTAVADDCAAAATPADREICADPSLQRLQRDLRRAYAEALQAHEDRALLRQRQLAWRDARNDVSDPGRLARLYEQRIQKLEAAAAQARSLR